MTALQATLPDLSRVLERVATLDSTLPELSAALERLASLESTLPELSASVHDMLQATENLQRTVDPIGRVARSLPGMRRRSGTPSGPDPIDAELVDVPQGSVE